MIALVLGVSILAFLFLYFAFNLGDDHFLLKMFLLFFFLSTILVLPKAAMEECNLLVDNETIINANITQYDYKTVCMSTTQSNVIFQKIPLWFFRIFATYSMIFLFWHWSKKSEKMISMISRIKQR